MTPPPADLRRFLMEFFNDEELDTFCFDYFPEAGQNFTAGMTKNRKVLLLIGHCERRGRLADLYAALARERSDPWNRQFQAPPAVTSPRRASTTPTPARDPRQIFLSHANPDAAFARALAGDLRAEGRPVWLAPDSIRPGEKWVEAIERGLAESSIFLLVLSPDALASRWVRTEAAAAIDLEHQGAMRVVPLETAATDVPWPLLWRQYQFISFRPGYAAGLDALLTRLDESETGVTATPPPQSPTLRSPVSPAPPLPSTPARPDRRVHEKTGITLIPIPAGDFLYGAPESDRLATGDEKPQRTENLPAFAIGRAPVTNAQYKRFLDANPNHPRPPSWKSKRGDYPRGKADHPVTVTLADAQAFCRWAGLRLPTDMEWEKAARGTDGRRWPWGDKPPTRAHANVNSYTGGTTPVGAYSPLGDSPYGCVDMAGNVNEWTATPFAIEPSYIVRGGDWTGTHRYTRTTRHSIADPTRYVGFRVAAELITR